MNDHVIKPINPDQLFTTLLKWIRPVAERTAVPQNLPASGALPGVEAPAELSQAEPEADELPESMPEFYLATGLERLMGNKRLYKKDIVSVTALAEVLTINRNLPLSALD